MKVLGKISVLLGLIFGLCQPVHASTIMYEVASLGGTQWEYTYTVINDTLGVDIEEFTVYFGLGLYDNLVPIDTPPNWDAIGINPDPAIPDDGFYDGLALNIGIAQGETLTGFSVQFDYFGTGAPGSQFFEIVDSLTTAVQDTGYTRPVPAPATVVLLGIGLLGIAGIRKKQSSAKFKK